MLKVAKEGGVEVGRVALMSGDVKGVADELGIVMLLQTSSHSSNANVWQQCHRETECRLLRYTQIGHQIHSDMSFPGSQR
jgi:hypothetical protein